MDRPLFKQRIERAFAVHPIVALLGPRQCGKTTIAEMYAEGLIDTPVHRYDLENPRDLQRLANPLLTLEEKAGLIIIDEVQRLPDLFPVLRVLADAKKAPKRQILLLGSVSRELLRQSSESLAGRIQYLEMTPFNTSEVKEYQKLWLRGGFPRAYLAANELYSEDWRRAFVTTFLEQDIPALGISIPPQALRRFWTMLAHYHGNIINLSELGGSFGVAHTTIRRYLDILSGTFMVRLLQPWWENISKRQVKTPKVYLRDSGIFHALLGITNAPDLEAHPKLGASWEGFALEEIIRVHAAEPGECYFWATHAGAELDLLLVQKGKRRGFEFKYSDSPRLTKSMQIAMEELKLDELWVLVPKSEDFPLHERIRVTSLENYGLTHAKAAKENA